MEIRLIWVIAFLVILLEQSSFNESVQTKSNVLMRDFSFHRNKSGIVARNVDRNVKIPHADHSDALFETASSPPRKGTRIPTRHKRLGDNLLQHADMVDGKPFRYGVVKRQGEPAQLAENADMIADELLKHGHETMRQQKIGERMETEAARRTTFIICFAIMGCCFICTVLTVKKLCSYE
ncbi:uncharacterized protein LOC110977373 [Acanthaster planci]|uniref:Uncharacterized protein LOC110977373 n=1 Tax=Acanthaster planci TaxID=133434 RepID=A0A8B7Y1S6_ACAPL|nr:uncharacterized protein LOC110977373 [Acanthaster planci]